MKQLHGYGEVFVTISRIDLEAIRARKLQDFDDAISGGARLARFEAMLGYTTAGIVTIALIAFVVGLAYLEPTAALDRMTLIWVVLLFGAIGILTVLWVRWHTKSWLAALLADTHRQRQEEDERHARLI